MTKELQVLIAQLNHNVKQLQEGNYTQEEFETNMVAIWVNYMELKRKNKIIAQS